MRQRLVVRVQSCSSSLFSLVFVPHRLRVHMLLLLATQQHRSLPGKQPRYHGHPFCGKGCSARATQDGWIDGRPPYGWAHTKRLPPPPRHTPPLGRWSALGKPKPVGPILFYEAHEDFYEFTNFWVCDQLTLDGQKWRTTEHYFQAQKFIDPQLKEICRLKATPRECFELVREPRCRGLIRGDWHRTEPGYAEYHIIGHARNNM